mmetsp:Transcript_31380/g.74561  ORF Transcript_31380/g.74561 Transcript_31380/m.74561 type:complete len:237 (+) Transcript_31380:624-1334(+)
MRGEAQDAPRVPRHLGGRAGQGKERLLPGPERVHHQNGGARPQAQLPHGLARCPRGAQEEGGGATGRDDPRQHQKRPGAARGRRVDREKNVQGDNGRGEARAQRDDACSWIHLRRTPRAGAAVLRAGQLQRRHAPGGRGRDAGHLLRRALGRPRAPQADLLRGHGEGLLRLLRQGGIRGATSAVREGPVRRPADAGVLRGEGPHGQSTRLADTAGVEEGGGGSRRAVQGRGRRRGG